MNIHFTDEGENEFILSGNNTFFSLEWFNYKKNVFILSWQTSHNRLYFQDAS